MIKEKTGQLYFPEDSRADDIGQWQELGEQGLENKKKILNDPEFSIWIDWGHLEVTRSSDLQKGEERARMERPITGKIKGAFVCFRFYISDMLQKIFSTEFDQTSICGKPAMRSEKPCFYHAQDLLALSWELS